jgi:hypothetical protein
MGKKDTRGGKAKDEGEKTISFSFGAGPGKMEMCDSFLLG